MGSSQPTKVTVKVEPLYFETLQDAFSKADRFVIICTRDLQKWITRSRSLSRTCRFCRGKIGKDIFPVAALVKRSHWSNAPNTIVHQRARFQVYPINTMVMKFKIQREQYKLNLGTVDMDTTNEISEFDNLTEFEE